MDINFESAKWQQDSDGGLWLLLKVQKDHIYAAKAFVASMPQKLHIATFKLFRRKRSLDANAYCWVLLQKIAEKVHSSKDEVYLEMLSRYGVFTHIVVKPSVVDRVVAEWRTVRNLGEIAVNGQTGIQLQCYFGSSTYDTKEMSKLIDGIVSEAQDLDIETETPEKLAEMKAEWDK